MNKIIFLIKVELSPLNDSKGNQSGKFFQIRFNLLPLKNDHKKMPKN